MPPGYWVLSPPWAAWSGCVQDDRLMVEGGVLCKGGGWVIDKEKASSSFRQPASQVILFPVARPLFALLRIVDRGTFSFHSRCQCSRPDDFARTWSLGTVRVMDGTGGGGRGLGAGTGKGIKKYCCICRTELRSSHERCCVATRRVSMPDLDPCVRARSRSHPLPSNMSVGFFPT